MSFLKTGSPQPLEVMTDICEKCKKNKAEFNVNGQMLCSTCKDELTKEKPANDGV